MPTYDYECARCGVMEIQQRMSDATLTACPTCKSKKFQRLISRGAGIIFKGDGFWETDYNRSGEYQAKAKAESGAPAAEAKSSEAKPSDSTSREAKPSESKPAATTTPAAAPPASAKSSKPNNPTKPAT